MMGNDMWNKWKKLYVDSLIAALKPSGDTLEVGFDTGHAATCIQKYKPKSHTIIENDPQIARKAKEWAAGQPKTKVIEEEWTSALRQLGIFDAIFFDGNPLQSNMDVLRSSTPEEIVAASNQAKTLLNEIKGKLSKIKVKFTDQEIDDFYQAIGQYNVNELFTFFNQMKEMGHITKKQYDKAIEKYRLNKLEKRSIVLPEDPMLIFLEECLKKHMRKGSRFSGFLPNARSKFDDAAFFDRIITNPNLHYEEQVMPIKVPHNDPVDALVMVVTKSA